MRRHSPRIWEMKDGRLTEKEGRLIDALGLGAKHIKEKISSQKEKGLPYIISLVGAGGKTTVMYCLARELAEDGWKTAVTTSTHIFAPEGEEEICLCLENEGWESRSLQDRKEEADAYFQEVCRIGKGAAEKRDFFTTGILEPEKPGERRKLSSLPPEFLKMLEKWADVLLIEADGSKRLPLKVPGPNEPVILPETSLVIGCAGLSSLGKPWREVCFRQEWAGDFFETEWVTEKSIADILTDERGTKKSVEGREYGVILNQGDSHWDRRRGEEILRLIEGGCSRCICASFR